MSNALRHLLPVIFVFYQTGLTVLFKNKILFPL
uniref:Uncharacterized protein n=1 Tax=Arundo donax TaxID=35708 RepID=A0A0A9A650_ARUDO